MSANCIKCGKPDSRVGTSLTCVECQKSAPTTFMFGRDADGAYAIGDGPLTYVAGEQGRQFWCGSCHPWRLSADQWHAIGGPSLDCGDGPIPIRLRLVVELLEASGANG